MVSRSKAKGKTATPNKGGREEEKESHGDVPMAKLG